MRAPRILTMLAVTVAATASACEPPPPPLEFDVVVAADAGDASPGDGACATAGGECTLRAAVEEANALGTAQPVSLTLAPGEHLLTAALDVTGAVTIVGATDGSVTLQVPQIHIASGASLGVTGLVIGYEVLDQGSEPARVVVEGTFVLLQSGIRDLGGSVAVLPGGTAVLVDSYLIGAVLDTVIDNASLLLLEHVTVNAIAATAVHTAEGATTHLRATAFLSPAVGRVPAGFGSACTGAQPVSGGYNTAWGSSCTLDGPGDQPGTNPWQPLSPDSTLVDGVPIGTLGCGNPGDQDRSGLPRPVDGNGDGVAACDIGADELQIP